MSQSDANPLFLAKIISLFPEMFPGPLGFSVAKRALEQSIWSYELINIRDFGVGRHKTVDSPQYGGGKSAVMRADVVSSAIEANLSGVNSIYYFSARGKLINQSIVREVIAQKSVMFICGRFEGIDERIIAEYNAVELSLGDFILSGGEIAALALLDACVRLLPGVLAKSHVPHDESFCDGMSGMLEHPLYTKPRVWRGHSVPDELLSGDHSKINRWKREQSLLITRLRRPDLIPGYGNEQ
jgi:tRNA (guanine37-N1)-methyltransferase